MCVAVSLLLGGCGGGDDDSSDAVVAEALCRSIGGGDATVSSTSAGASVENPGAAIDADFASFATVTFGGAGTASMRGSPQFGVVVPGGTAGGAVLERPGNVSIGISAYLLEAPVASCEIVFFGTGNVEVTGPCRHSFRGNIGFVGVAADLDYDSVELSLQAADETARIFEFCTRTEGA